METESKDTSVTKRKEFKEENLNEDNKKEVKKLPYKQVRKWVQGYYYRNSKGKRVHVKGHYKYVKIWVPSKW